MFRQHVYGCGRFGAHEVNHALARPSPRRQLLWSGSQPPQAPLSPPSHNATTLLQQDAKASRFELMFSCMQREHQQMPKMLLALRLLKQSPRFDHFASGKGERGNVSHRLPGHHRSESPLQTCRASLHSKHVTFVWWFSRTSGFYADTHALVATQNAWSICLPSHIVERGQERRTLSNSESSYNLRGLACQEVLQ